MFTIPAIKSAGPDGSAPGMDLGPGSAAVPARELGTPSDRKAWPFLPARNTFFHAPAAFGQNQLNVIILQFVAVVYRNLDFLPGMEDFLRCSVIVFLQTGMLFVNATGLTSLVDFYKYKRINKFGSFIL